jgi:hypothetical protein
MPRRDELPGLLLGKTYSLSVEGTPALLREEVVTQDEFTAGDKVELFALPDGRTFITKVDPNTEQAYTVGRVTPAHIYFDDEMTVQEA